MMRTVQLSITDSVYAAALRDALSHSGPWEIVLVERPNPALAGVLVVDESGFARLPLPLPNPERVVLITRHQPQLMAEAWDAGIVSVVSMEDPLPTVLLAIMAATLRVAKIQDLQPPRGISPSGVLVPARISSENRTSRSRRCKTQ